MMPRAQHPEDYRIVPCEACGSEGYESYTATIYEPGCGYGHDDVFLDYGRPCRYCEGTGGAIIPVEPVTLDDLTADEAVPDEEDPVPEYPDDDRACSAADRAYDIAREQEFD